jgi:predicted enzyme related to lactoylglutathione lyase
MSELVWWEVESRDPALFIAFHTALWGWNFRREFQDTELGADYWIIVDEGTGIGGLQQAATAEFPHAGARLYFKVEDLESTIAHAISLGGVLERPRTELGGDDRWFATILDPTGVSFGLWTANPAVQV